MSIATAAGLAVALVASGEVRAQLAEPRLQPPSAWIGRLTPTERVADGISTAAVPTIAASAFLVETLGGAEAEGFLGRAADAAISASLAAELLKRLVPERRPPGLGEQFRLPPERGLDAFASGHMASCVAYATLLEEQYPHQRSLWYLLAAGVGWSRTEVRAHSMRDVAVGAVVGYVIGRMSVRTDGGLLNIERWRLLKPQRLGNGVLTPGPIIAPDQVILIKYEW